MLVPVKTGIRVSDLCNEKKIDIYNYFAYNLLQSNDKKGQERHE